jgi:uncharacterized GH25 family protein
MGKKIGVALAVMVVAVLVGWRLRGGHETAQPRVAPAVATKSQPVAMASTEQAPAATRALPLVYDDDPTGPLRLEGQVIDDHDAPVANAVVTIDANPPRTTKSEGDGSFAFDGLIRRDYRLEATAGELYAGPARLRLGDKAEPVTLRMHRGGALDVSVTSDGKPVAGADVELRSTGVWTAKTGADGVAKLRGIGATWAALAVRAEGYAPGALMVTTSGQPDTIEHVAVSLAHGAAVAGRVVDEKGKPIANARVVATNASEPLPVVDPRRDGVLTDASGKFALPALSAGTWRLAASDGMHAPTTSVPLTVDGNHARNDVELVLAAGGVVHGTVKSKAGVPVAGANVSVVGQGTVFWRARRQAFTDANGQFSIAGLARRPVDVVAWHESGASTIAPVDLVAKADNEVAITLDVTGTLVGTVVDKAGKPIAEAQVIAEPEWSGSVKDRAEWLIRGIQETVADQAGGFTFAGLPDGTYRVRAARPGAAEAAIALTPGVVAKPGAAPIKVVVAADGRAVGKIELQGKAPAAFALTLGSTNPVPFATKDGSFALPAAGGTFPLTVSGPGFVELTKTVTIEEGKDTDLGTIKVTAGRSISGRVLDESGTPVAKATVAAGDLLTGGGAELYIKDESINAQDTQTDEHGRFVMQGFGEGLVTIVAGKAELGRSASVRLPPGGDSLTIDLVLAPTTKLEGKVTKAGAPLADTVIIANPIGALASNFFVTTGPDGTFALDSLAPGAYIVYPMLGGGGSRPKDIYTRKVELVLGKTTHIDVDATPGPVTLTVSVKTDKGAPVAQAQLLAIAAKLDPKTIDEIRDGTHVPFGDVEVPIHMRGISDGAATIEGMRPGDYTLCVLLGPETFKCAQTKVTTQLKQLASIVTAESK